MSGISNSFQINEKVAFLYEKGGGIVRRFDANGLIFVEDEDGFERPFPSNELVKIYGSDYHLPEDDLAHLIEDGTISTSQHTIRKEKQSGSNKSMDVWEIDLHIESLLDSNLGMSNSEILAVQMKEFRDFFNRAKAKNVRKIIVIHGVGAGVLKDDVRLFLDKKDGIEYYDADFREYGKGATAIEIRYTQL